MMGTDDFAGSSVSKHTVNARGQLVERDAGHTAHCTPHTINYTLHTTHYMIHNTHYALKTTHYTLYTVH